MLVSTLDANGLRFHVRALGGPPSPQPGHRPVVMLHDLLTENLSSFYFTVANSVAQLTETLLYDLRGHGHSEVPTTGYRLDDHIADLAGILDAQPWDEPVHLVGHGYGGAIALTYACRHPARVASLVLLDAYLSVHGWDDDGWRHHLATQVALAHLGQGPLRPWTERYGPPKLARRSQHATRLLNETMLAHDLDDEPPLAPEVLTELKVPVLGIYGGATDMCDRTELLERYIPEAEVQIVPGCAETTLFEATDYVRHALLTWLEEQR